VAAEPKPQPEPIETQPEQPEERTHQEREAERQRRFDALSPFLERLDPIKLESLLTFKRILDRDRGCTTPVESFIEGLVNDYKCEDEAGRGLTLIGVEWRLAQFRQEYSSAIEQARFIANRYALSEASDAE
jgi:hypothetical protein